MGKATTFIITAFGSSRPQPGSQAYETAQALGAALAKSGFVVANGGYGGTMEATARGAREAGGTTIGVTAEPQRPAERRWKPRHFPPHGQVLSRIWGHLGGPVAAFS